MSLTTDHEPLEPTVPAQQIADIQARLEDLDTASSGTAESLQTPRDYLNRASELMLAESHPAVLETLLAGWGLVERRMAASAVSEADPLVLEYMSAVIDRCDHSGDEALTSRWFERRLDYLESRGLHSQAQVERTLGLASYRDPRPEDYTLIERVATGVLRSDDAVTIRLVYGVALEAQARHAEAISVLEGAREVYARRGLVENECAAMFFLIDACVQMGDEETALEYIHRIVERTGNRALIGMVLMKRARLTMGASSKNSATLYDLLNSLELFTAAGIRTGATMAAMTLGAQLQEIEATECAVAAFAVAVEHAERSENSLRSAALSALGNAHVQNEEPDDAVRVLTRLLDLPEPENGSQAAERAIAYNALAHAQMSRTEHLEAELSWQESVKRFLEAGDAESASGAAANVSRLAFADNRMEDAMTWIQTAVGITEKHELHPMRGAEHMAFLAVLLGKQKSEEALAVIDAVIAIAEQFEASFHLPQYLETRAMVLLDLGRPDEAVAGTLLAGDSYADVGEDDEGTRCDIRAGDLLRQLDRNVEAASVYRSAIGRNPDRPDFLFAAYKGLSESLSSLGQAQEAQHAAEQSEEWAVKAKKSGLSLD